MTLAPTADASAKDANANVYVVQGVAGSTVSISVDGKQVDPGAAAKAIVGPLALPAGTHSVAIDGPGTAQDVTSTIKVTAGSSVDVVVHRQVDPAAKPVITTYANDLSPVANASGRLVVAHTAAVGPADIRVKGKVLFSNIASGESLTLTVPAATYPVEIVPTATTGPVVLGPVDLPVAKSALTRVFAIGVAATGTMDAVVQVLPLPARGNGTTPNRVDAGSGGQAAALINSSHDGDRGAAIPWGIGVLVVGAAAVTLRRRRATRT
ncbi:hypothetical protein VV02_24270 [Luteipulveratus mongoliensis]|uniref:DUF4397 domain-containing protein n=1 Tax=Luteipulveratus mongoliensis TaxID=571913 RepID=A0A0K1JRU5_9MICO|nr:hypothetical protein VV02_24270 [Luteipulveratus mongoliensis]